MRLPKEVRSGQTFDAAVSLYLTSAATGVFNPCPAFYVQLQPQSARATTTYWTLPCTAMEPVQFGDVITFDIPLTAPAGLATQTMDLDLGFGRPPLIIPGQQPYVPGQTRLSDHEQLMVTGRGAPLQPVAYHALTALAPPEPLLRTVEPDCGPAQLRASGYGPDATHASVGSTYLTFRLRDRKTTTCAVVGSMSSNDGQIQ